MRNIYEDGRDCTPGDEASQAPARDAERRQYRSAQQRREERERRNERLYAAADEPSGVSRNTNGYPPVYSTDNRTSVSIAAPYQVSQTPGQPVQINDPLFSQPGYSPYAQPGYPPYVQSYPPVPPAYPGYLPPQGYAPYAPYPPYPQQGYVPPAAADNRPTAGYASPSGRSPADNGVPHTDGMRIVYQSPDYYNSAGGSGSSPAAQIPVITPGSSRHDGITRIRPAYASQQEPEVREGYAVHTGEAQRQTHSPYSSGKTFEEELKKTGTKAERHTGFSVSTVDAPVNLSAEERSAVEEIRIEPGRIRTTGTTYHHKDEKKNKQPDTHDKQQKKQIKQAAKAAARAAKAEDDKAKRSSDGEQKNEASGQPVTAAEKARVTVLIISIVVAIGSLAYLGYEFKQRMDNRKLEQEFSVSAQAELTETTKKKKSDKKDKEKSTTESSTLSDEEYFAKLRAENPGIMYPVGLQARFAPYYTENQDFVGYITIDGLGISLPVVQGEDDEEYLKKNFYGQYTKYGCPFVMHLNNMEIMDKNTIIYGHYMRDGSVFAALHDYKSIDGFRAAPVITFNTIYKDYKWKIIGVIITNTYAEDDNGYFFRYYFTNLSNEKNFEDYLEALKVRSLYNTGVDVLPTDKLLTLSTCSYEFSDARLVVVARMVRPGESAAVDTSLASVNENPRYPQAYYDKKDKKNPFDTTYNWYPEN